MEDGSDTLLRKYIYGEFIDEPIILIDVADDNTVHYYHYDGLGFVIALSDVNNLIVEHYSYDVFGEPNRTSDVNNPYFFTGRRLDTETDNYYYRARYYHPGIGRFLQRDPIFALNLYTYCSNNPINWIDPWGLCESKDADLPWYKKLGLSIVLPSFSGFYWLGGGAGHEFVWVPGQGWRSYVYPQGGLGNPGYGINIGAGPVFNISNHDNYLGHYINIQGMSPLTPWGSFGSDISFWPGSPTAIHFDWGASTGGISAMYQNYNYTSDIARIIRNSQREWMVQQNLRAIQGNLMIHHSDFFDY